MNHFISHGFFVIIHIIHWPVLVAPALKSSPTVVTPDFPQKLIHFGSFHAEIFAFDNRLKGASRSALGNSGIFAPIFGFALAFFFVFMATLLFDSENVILCMIFFQRSNCRIV